MDHNRLREVLATFADDPSGLHVEKSNIMVQIQGEVISARMSQKPAGLYIEEDGIETPVAQWVSSRIARLDSFASNILQMIPPCEDFINSRAHLLDQLEYSSSVDPTFQDDALAALTKIAGRQGAGMCSVLYLTSDAGEGKTTLINQLARMQAESFRAKNTSWLLVPIALGGSPFLRLDNVIAAALLNQLRFRRFYFEGFMQLVRLGYIVLALDGFEEVFVETDGDAVSSLGSLIADLKGEGTLVVAARTAYFDFRRLDQQARLIDAIPGFDVSFAKLSLDRWGEREFLDICTLEGIEDGSKLYGELSAKLSESHPLLTRAVFVRRLVELATDQEGLSFITETDQVNDLFHPFIDTILGREIRQKWIDKFSEVAVPLLSREEHHELLQLIAEEMWLSKRTSLPLETCESLAEIFCDAKRKSPSVNRQIKERLSTHALLVSDATKSQISFDHDHFREFFLGELVSVYAGRASQPDLRKLLRVDALPNFSLDIAVSYMTREDKGSLMLSNELQAMAATEASSSLVRENVGSLLIRMLSRSGDGAEPCVIKGLSFPPDALAGRRLSRIDFEGCYFRPTVLGQDVTNAKFTNCEFEYLEIAPGSLFQGVTMRDPVISGFAIMKNDQESISYFDPKAIRSLLASKGVSILENDHLLLNLETIAEEDYEIECIRKLITVFSRSLNASEKLLTLKFGVHASEFFQDVLPSLLDLGLVEEVPHRGAGYQRNFRLGKPVAEIADALAVCRGSFSKMQDVLTR